MRTENKLIAEFMGYKVMEEEKFLTYDYPKGTDLTKIMVDVAMKYHTSWDWLMPVVEKCFDTQQPSEGQHYFINESLLTMKIEVVYDRVVEFIKTYNDVQTLREDAMFQQMDSLPPHVQ